MTKPQKPAPKPDVPQFEPLTYALVREGQHAGKAAIVVSTSADGVFVRIDGTEVLEDPANLQPTAGRAG